MASDNKSAYVELGHYGSKNSPPASTTELLRKEGEEQARVPDSPQDEAEYPSIWKLIPVMIGLCCAVFCMALVWCYVSHNLIISLLTVTLHRTTQSSRLQFQKLPPNSIRLMTWAGMVVLTC